MSLSSMPTGTVSRDGAGSRTYPPDEPERGSSTAAASSAPASTSASPRGHRQSPAGDTRGRDALQRENEALRRANARLNARLDSADADRQEIIDRYERLLAESRGRGRQQTHGRSGRRTDRSRRSGSESNAVAAVRAVADRVVDRVASAFGRR
ncbi:hypothetical protein C5B91_14580 [Haloferax sp. Atlit-10N]|uniref:hypothetical protein n=1 Tax=unclassified Haloferax TaxID=2625095 RepID=UPI000E236FDB|nr:MULTISPECIES: hypothetical protein [unclassified Haloferax]RDZ43345.1 hypothetical protein C5B87_15410 [Haloferax sp. Atlit-16N]RDZ57919.1 hypothetical protein C5B91_14580 [Haloferax sp. Atlit-10N]